MITLKDVSKSYGRIRALASTSLEVPRGGTTVLIGPSGCGKSTLLRLIVGLVTPDTGDVQIDGEAMSPENALTLRRRIGYVVQDGGLFPHLTAEGNIAMMARWLGWPAARVEERLVELIRLTHFPEDALRRYPLQLSGGQRQRVALMRALMLDPDVLLLDEPLGALDPVIRYDLQTELREIFQCLAKTVVLVTHDIGEAGYFGDRIVLMREGEVVQTGSLGDLLNRPAEPFVERFVTAQRGLLDLLQEAVQ